MHRDGGALQKAEFKLIQAMAPFHLTTSLLGIGLAVLIVWLIRRDDLYLRHALFWLTVAIAAAVFGVWPRSLDGIGQLVGVQYSPALALLCAVIVLLIKALHADVVNTRMETDLLHVQQSVALLEAELTQLRLERTRATDSTAAERRVDSV